MPTVSLPLSAIDLGTIAAIASSFLTLATSKAPCFAAAASPVSSLVPQAAAPNSSAAPASAAANFFNPCMDMLLHSPVRRSHHHADVCRRR